MTITKALLFDLDGTLVDTTQIADFLWREWASNNRIDPSPIVAEMHGMNNQAIISKYGAHLDLEFELEKLLGREMDMSHCVEALPGAKSILENLGSIPWGIVTMSSRGVALSKLKAAGLPVPNVLVCADDITESKPSPMAFLEGANRLNIDPQYCFVFEDSLAGIESANRAQMDVAQIMFAGHCAPSTEIKTFNDWNNIKISMNNENVFIEFSK